MTTRAEAIEAAARAALESLQSMTSEDFSHGADRVVRMALTDALALPPDSDNGLRLAIGIANDALADAEEELNRNLDIGERPDGSPVPSPEMRALNYVQSARSQLANILRGIP